MNNLFKISLLIEFNTIIAISDQDNKTEEQIVCISKSSGGRFVKK